MKSPTHFLIGHCCARALRWQGRDARLLIVGACVPDLPIILCWPAIGIYTVMTGGAFDLARFRMITDGLYFSDSILSGLHNLLHSPVSLGFLFLVAGILFPASAIYRRAVMIVLAGALTHSLVDIVSHVEDGPLVLWPLENTIRIRGPVSHWDPAYGGIWVSGIEIVGAVVFGLWHGCRRLYRASFFAAFWPSTLYSQPEHDGAGGDRLPGETAGWIERVSPLSSAGRQLRWRRSSWR